MNTSQGASNVEVECKVKKSHASESPVGCWWIDIGVDTDGDGVFETPGQGVLLLCEISTNPVGNGNCHYNNGPNAASILGPGCFLPGDVGTTCPTTTLISGTHLVAFEICHDFPALFGLIDFFSPVTTIAVP